jgi:2-polyprenyl-3-methyl-5-hydroxy-6-metoxy-1,4-benzoquinol methylase
MSVREHYEKHLGHFYSWMSGDFQSKQKQFQNLLRERSVKPQNTRVAIDLGAGHGIQSVALAHLGYEVIAVDFNQQLLDELKENARGLAVEVVNDDIRNIKKYADRKPELISCCGDTLTHLDSLEQIAQFISDVSASLSENGKFIVSFRDYSQNVRSEPGIIPVKSDDSRILTVILHHQNEKIQVTDLLYERKDNAWTTAISSYYKTVICPAQVKTLLEDNGMRVLFSETVNGMVTVVGEKG